jgi:hypothetical protein
MVSFCEGLRMPVPWMPQPHPASAGVGKPAMHEVAEGRVGGRSGLYGDLMPGAGPADRASSGQLHRWSMRTEAIGAIAGLRECVGRQRRSMIGADFQHLGKRRCGWLEAGSTPALCCFGGIFCAS